MSILDRCNPRLIRVDDSCGCTMTRATIEAWTSADIENLGFKEVGLDKIIAQTKELRMTGVKQRPLMDLLISRMKAGKQNILGTDQHNRSVISPFTLVPQRSIVNSNYFVISAGVADPGAGIGGVHAGSWNITVASDTGLFATTLSDVEKYFLIGKYVTILTQDPVTKVGRTLQFKVTASVDAGANATVTIEPPYSAAGWAALTAAQQLVYHPGSGVVVNMANSVSNFESWCYQYPAENTVKLRDFWWQTMRRTWCYNDEYVKALNAPETGTWFKKFRTLALADQRKRQGEQEDRDFFNTVFYGDRINEHQTDTDYKNLPQVQDPAVEGTCILEYKANTLGIRTQLAGCGKVIDMNNAPLDIDLIKELLYALRRHRGLDGIADIDIMGDRFTYVLFQTAFIEYVKDRYGIDTTRFYTPGQKLVFKDQVMWNYDTFEFPEDGVRINFFHDDYFDDLLAAFPANIKNRGRQLWILDWSDIDIAVTDVRSVNRQTNVADNLYNCIIQANVNHYQLQSKTVQIQIGDPNRHLIIENFNDQCAKLTAAPCTPAS